MGRTNPTFRNILEAITNRWGAYRRALRRRDQPYFDQLFEYADAHADAAGFLNTDNPMDAVLFSMLIEQQKQLSELETQLTELEAQTKTREDPNDSATQ